MVTLIKDKQSFQPNKKYIISNYVYLEFDNGKISVGFDKEDLEAWLKQMKQVTK